MRFTLFVYGILGALSFMSLPASGQDTVSNGVVHVIDWPNTIERQRTIDSLRVHSPVLPDIDTLTIGYGYKTIDDRPALSFALEWKQGPTVLLDGETLDWDELRGDLLIESIQVRVDIERQGVLATQVDFVVDSLMLEPYPGLFSEVVRDFTWDTIFPDLDAAAARELFASGFELANPNITHITFVYFGDEEAIARNNPPPIRPRRPSRRTVYGPSVDIFVHFPVHISRPRDRPSTGDPTLTREPRGERVGRGDTTDDDRPRTSEDDRRRTGDSGSGERGERAERPEENDDSGGDIFGSAAGKKKKKKDDDDEDEDELLPAAIAGAAAVVLVAAAGGTVGYYGNTRHGAIGLSSGYVQPKGGVLLQVAINSAVIEQSNSDTEHFLGKITGFYDLFNAPVQPAIGLGVLASELNGSFDYEFNASVGLAGNFGQLLILTGYDLTAGGMDIGVAYNFRAKK